MWRKLPTNSKKNQSKSSKQKKVSVGGHTYPPPHLVVKTADLGCMRLLIPRETKKKRLSLNMKMSANFIENSESWIWCGRLRRLLTVEYGAAHKYMREVGWFRDVRWKITSLLIVSNLGIVCVHFERRKATRLIQEDKGRYNWALRVYRTCNAASSDTESIAGSWIRCGTAQQSTAGKRGGRSGDTVFCWRGSVEWPTKGHQPEHGVSFAMVADHQTIRG